jgi:RND family efflux transporter MFP subunit
MKKTVILAALIVSVTSAILYGVWAARPVAEVYVAQRGTAISAVYGTVKIQSTLTMNVRARNTGTIRFSDRIVTNTAVGMVVTQGELLATISNEDLDREITKAETDLKAAEERRQIGPPSQQQLNTQEALLTRLEKLAAMQNVPATDLERTRNDVESLHEQVRGQELEMDRQVTILRETAGVLQDRKAHCFVTAPMEGYLNSINCINGEFINEGSNPFAIATASTYIEGQINEEDVGIIAAGMKATVRLYSFANQDFIATVSQVLPTANDQRYTITLALDKPPANLMSGMTGEMNIIAGKHENALIVPTRAVLANRVLVVKDGVIKPRTVKIGFRNLEHTEILDGLKEGEQVVVADQDLFKPGQRVRAVTINL